MAPFRGSDGRLDREIEALEAVARTRVRRVARERRELDRELSELRRERGRRRATAETFTAQSTKAAAEP